MELLNMINREGEPKFAPFPFFGRKTYPAAKPVNNRLRDKQPEPRALRLIFHRAFGTEKFSENSFLVAFRYSDAAVFHAQ